MPQPLSGPGLGLPLPQNLYPSELNNAPYDASNNHITLAGGDSMVVPAGDWFVSPGNYSFIQYSDPVLGTWRGFETGRGGTPTFVKSDGFNYRVANLTGCPVGAIVVAGGSSYVQSTTTVTPSTGNSTWQAIVGGQLSYTSMSSNGANYGVTPIVLIDSPPSPGVPATANAVMASGTITSIAFTNVGAGYKSVPNVVILPNPTDPNINSGITQATAAIGLAGTTISGAITAVLCTNPGQPTSTLPTLTVTGAGSSASVVAVTVSTLTSATVTAGAGYTNGATQLQTFAGTPAGTPAYTNPIAQFTNARSRPASANVVTGATTTTIGTIYDGGLFFGTPSAWLPASGVITTVGTVTLVTGTTVDTIVLQPAP